MFGDSAFILRSNHFLLSEVMPTGDFTLFKKSGIAGRYRSGRIYRTKTGRLRLVLTGPIVKKDSPRDPDWRLRSQAFDRGVSGNIYSLKNQVEARIGDIRIIITGIMPKKVLYNGTSVELKASVVSIRIWHFKAPVERAHSIYWHWNAPEYPSFEYTRDDLTISKPGRLTSFRLPGVMDVSYEQYANDRHLSYTRILLCGNPVIVGRDAFSSKQYKPFFVWFPGKRLPAGREKRSIQSALALITGKMTFPMSHVELNKDGEPIYQEFYDSLDGKISEIRHHGRYPAVIQDYRNDKRPVADEYEKWLGKLISKYHEISASRKMKLDEIIHLMFASQTLTLDTRHLPLARALDLFNMGARKIGLVKVQAHVDKADFKAFLRAARKRIPKKNKTAGWQRISAKMGDLNNISQTQAIRELPSILGVGVGVVEKGIVYGRNTAVHASAWEREDDALMMDYEGALAFLQRMTLALIGHTGSTVDHTARGRRHSQSLVAIQEPLSGGGESKSLRLKTRFLAPYRREKHFYR